jgi:predicted phosphoribosyltransferase
MPFMNRSDAGRKLAHALAKYKSQKAVVLALPRGGVPVASEVAAALQAPRQCRTDISKTASLGKGVDLGRRE